jgi:hypothetical protein
MFRCRSCGAEFDRFVGGLLRMSQRFCEACGSVGSVSAGDQRDPGRAWFRKGRIVGDPHSLDDEQFARITGPCPKCGGRFRQDASPRCPGCLSNDLEDLGRNTSHPFAD